MYIQRCSIQPSHRALRPDSRPNFEKRCHIIPVPVKTILKVLYAAVFKGTTNLLRLNTVRGNKSAFEPLKRTTTPPAAAGPQTCLLGS